MPPDHIACDIHTDMARPGGGSGPRSGFTFIGSAGHIKACGEGQNRRRIDARHGGQHGGGIRPTREKHAIGHVAALMQIYAFHQRRIQPRESGFFRDIFRPFCRQRGTLVTRDDAAIGDGNGLTRQHATNAFEDRLRTCGELQLQHFMQCGAMELRRYQPSRDQRLRFRGKGDAAWDFGDVKWLDAEGIARQHHLPCGTVMNGNAIHTAQILRESGAIAAIQM